LEFRADFLEAPLRLHPVDGGPLEALLRATNLRAIARFDLSKPLQLPIGFLRGWNADTSVSSARKTGFKGRSGSGRLPHRARHWYTSTPACRGPRRSAGRPSSNPDGLPRPRGRAFPPPAARARLP